MRNAITLNPSKAAGRTTLQSLASTLPDNVVDLAPFLRVIQGWTPGARITTEMVAKAKEAMFDGALKFLCVLEEMVEKKNEKIEVLKAMVKELEQKN